MQPQIHETVTSIAIRIRILCLTGAAMPPCSPATVDRGEAASAGKRQQGRMR
jgi:hypothetical protein